MRTFASVALAMLALTGCVESADTKAQKQAADIAIEAVTRNISDRSRVSFISMQVVPKRYGAVCGSMSVDNAAFEQFWVGGTDQPGRGTPILERWSDDRSKNSTMFNSYCAGMKRIDEAFYERSHVGRQTEEDRKKADAEEAALGYLARKKTTISEEKDAAKKERAITAKWNENARAYNARIKAAYERGSQVCRNLEEAGYNPGRGCPRPEPTYLKLR